MARRHWLFGLALAGAVALRVLAMLAFRPIMWFGGDSASYLATGLRLIPDPSRVGGYGFMLWVLKPLHSLALVAAVQHLMGLAMGVLIYLLARRCGLPAWAATLATIPVLFDAYELQLESDAVPDIPFGFLRAYIAKVQRGETLERPMEAVIAERDRIVDEYTELIDSDEDRATFQAKLGLARTVFPYVENHNFYVEHWAHSVVWRKMRDLGRVLVSAGFFAAVDDVFLLSRHEVPEVLCDLYHGWAVGVPSRGPKYWPREMGRLFGR